MPLSYLVIGEQMVEFRGCPFRMYMSNKLSKNCRKNVMVCDSFSKYLVNTSCYIGKKTKTNGMPMAILFVKDVNKFVRGSNKKFTINNCLELPRPAL